MKREIAITMKKFLALILTLAMALSVTACGGGDDTADTDSQENADASGREAHRRHQPGLRPL